MNEIKNLLEEVENSEEGVNQMIYDLLRYTYIELVIKKKNKEKDFKCKIYDCDLLMQVNEEKSDFEIYVLTELRNILDEQLNPLLK